MRNAGDRRRALLRELLVPALMLCFVAAYWWQAAALSREAQVFPAALTLALLVLLGVELVNAWRARHGPVEQPTAAAPSAPVERLRTQVLRRVGLVLLAVVLTALWREVGGTLVIFAFCLGALLITGERRALLLVGLPLTFAVVLTYLFKVVLLVRFPDGLFALF